MAATGPVRMARRAAGFAVAALIVFVLPIVALAIMALASPYASVAIPASCSAVVPHMPADRDSTVPGVGIGTLLASGSDTNVVVVADPGQTSTLTAYIVDGQAGKVLDRIDIASQAVVAAISDGVAYLFDDKIGYMIDASTGERVHRNRDGQLPGAVLLGRRALSPDRRRDHHPVRSEPPVVQAPRLHRHRLRLLLSAAAKRAVTDDGRGPVAGPQLSRWLRAQP